MKKRDFPPIHPGEILVKEFLEPLKISQYRLAKDIGVTAREILQDKMFILFHTRHN